MDSWLEEGEGYGSPALHKAAKGGACTGLEGFREEAGYVLALAAFGEREQMGLCGPGHNSRPTGCHREEDFTSKGGRASCRSVLCIQRGMGCGEKGVAPVMGGNADRHDSTEGQGVHAPKR